MAIDQPSMGSILAATGMFSGGGGGKPGAAFGWLTMEWHASGSMALQAAAPLGKQIPSLLQPMGKSGGIADKFLQAVQSIPDELRSKLANAGIMHSGTGTVHVESNIAPPIRSGGMSMEA